MNRAFHIKVLSIEAEVAWTKWNSQKIKFPCVGQGTHWYYTLNVILLSNIEFQPLLTQHCDYRTTALFHLIRCATHATHSFLRFDIPNYFIKLCMLTHTFIYSFMAKCNFVPCDSYCTHYNEIWDLLLTF